MGCSIALPRSVFLTMVTVFLSHIAWAAPVEDGLVLWLDATDTGSVTRDASGRVGRWADKSSLGNDATQQQTVHQPVYERDGLGGKPAIRFGGNEFLNIGRPQALDFRSGHPFTIVVVHDVGKQDHGTFISKGGGTASERAYQCYAAPGRIGAITYGVMRENPRPSQTHLAIYLCDGRQAEVFLDGRSVLKFGAGTATSSVDVLVGARRETADNKGIYYALTGELSEILVYDRALSRGELSQLQEYLNQKYLLHVSSVEELVAQLSKPQTPSQIASLADQIGPFGEAATGELKTLIGRCPETAPQVAELLKCLAERNELCHGLAGLSAELLHHDDPFARGLAEWAIAMKVGGENSGQQAAWPGPQPPSWFHTWCNLSAEQQREADWVRQAVCLGIHDDTAKLLNSVEQMIERADRMRVDFAHAGLPPTSLDRMARDIHQLRGVRDRLARLGGDTPNAMTPTDLKTARHLWIEARNHLRSIVMANPALRSRQIIFVKRFAPHTVRNITRSYSWKHKPGGDICVVDLATGGEVRRLLDGRLGPGYAWGMDLSWEGDRVVFGYARQPNWPPDVDTTDATIEGRNVFRLRKIFEPLHLFEINADGTELVQRTSDPYWNDFEPTYCANGQIVFASDRCGRAAECGNDTYDHSNPNLYVLSPDGSVKQLTDSKDIDRYPHSLADGRIAYTHWEYQERHFMEVHAVWTLRPDGTMCDALYKHHMRAPCGLRDTRSIPGSSKLVSIATGHHTFAYGPVVVIDPAFGLNSEVGLSIVTPGVQPQEGPMAGEPVAGGGVADRGGLYQTPWALSESCFLVSYAYPRPNCPAPAGADSNGFGIYVIDTYGNRELVHRDPLLSCVCPIPLTGRPRPARLPDEPLTAKPYATCYVADVYAGLEGIPRGTVKYLRIAQHVGWPFDPDRGQMDYIPGNASTRRIDFQSWSPVRVIGTVPVEEDGSASFIVPPDTGIYFQALDERQMEVRRMRSVVSLKAGEVRGCYGCHESRAAAPIPRNKISLAWKHAPQVPSPPPWGAERLLGYEWLVQPILDRHCVRCHGHEDPEGGLDFTSTRGADGLFQSFRTMFGKLPGGQSTGRLLVACSDRFSSADVTQPKEFGSHQSPLIRVLLDDPLHRREAKLPRDDWIALVTWVDANAPYHDGFMNKRPLEGERPEREPYFKFGRFAPHAGGLIDDLMSSAP